MADNLMLNVGPGFSFDDFVDQLANLYRGKGYKVNIANMYNCHVLTFDKGTGGINTLLGLGEGIKATCTFNNNVLSITYSDGDWTGKIVGLAVGWFLCFIPFITAIIGCLKQSELPKNINNDASMIIGTQYPGQYQQPQYQQPQYQQPQYQQPQYQQPQYGQSQYQQPQPEQSQKGQSGFHQADQQL